MTQWMDAARAEIGTRETVGPEANPDVVSYYAEAGHPEVTDDETAWCAAYVGAMLARSGLPSTGSLAARSYLNYGRKIDQPEPGCIVVFWRGSPTSWQGHVAFYVRDDGAKHVRVLGGNQNNAVSEARYPKSQVLGYRMPVAPKVVARQATKQAVQSSRTIFGVLTAAGASIVGWFKDAVTQIDLLEPVKQLGSGLGVNLTTVVFGITVAGLALALFARLDDAHNGRTVK